MSHFFTVVILPHFVKEDEIENKINELMEPYDERLQVPPYPETCYCVGLRAYEEVKDEIEAKFGAIDYARELFNKKYESQKKRQTELLDNLNLIQPEESIEKELEEIRDFLDKKWQEEVIKHRKEYQEKLFEAHPLKDQADPDCEECNGTGMVLSTYNPKSKWDWYVVGGRWDGELQANRQPPTDDGFNFGPQHHQLKHNTDKVKNLITNDIIPFAIVTPDGEWIERGQLGWWAVVSDEKEKKEWKDQVTNIYMKYLDYMAVGIDCHI